MGYCNQCGKQLNTDAKFCPECGASVTSMTDDQSNPSADNDLIYKGIGIRLLAHIVDGIPMLILFMVIGFFVVGLTGEGKTADGFELQGGPAMLFFLLLFIAGTLYFALLEAYWGGQTLGKKMARIKVTRLDGSPISFGQALSRNLWRVVDGFLFYLPGIISIWRSPLKQRIGDRMAETIVIKKTKLAGESKPKKKSRLKFGSSDYDMMDID